MGIYEKYVAPAVRYLTYLSFLTAIIIFGLELRKIYSSDCRIMIFDALAKPMIPAMIFTVLFFWKEINEFVSKSVLVGGEKEPETPKTPKTPDTPDTPESPES